MRLIFILLSLLLTFSVSARPRIGDYLHLSDAAKLNSLEVKLLGYDVEAEEFDALKVETINGVRKESRERVPVYRIWGEEQIESALATCEYPVESITVPAGVFEVCRNIFQVGDAYGRIPFGIVVRTYNDVKLRALSFTRGTTEIPPANDERNYVTLKEQSYP